MVNLFFLTIYVFLFGTFDPSTSCIILIIHFSLCSILYLREKKGITPIFIFYVGIILTTIANFVVIGKVGTHTLKLNSYLIPKYISDALQIWCISSTIIAIGYQLNKERSFPSIAFEIKTKKFFQGLFWFLVFANSLTLFGYDLPVRGNQVGKIFVLINSISILVFARIWSKENNKTYRFYALSLFVVETYLALVTSYLRSDLILPTVYLFLGYFIGKGDIKYLFSYRIIPFVLILLLYSSVFKILQSNRSSFITVFTEGGASEKNDENSSALLDRSANIAQLTNIVSLVKKNGYYEGRASAPLLAAIIPRALWPDKPLIQLGAWFALESGNAYKSETGRANNSINMTIPGELYLDFGWIGLIIGSLGIGALMSALWNSTKFYSSEYNLTGTLFGGYLFIMSISGFGGDLQIVITFLSTYISFFIIKKFAGRSAQTSK